MTKQGATIPYTHTPFAFPRRNNRARHPKRQNQFRLWNNRLNAVFSEREQLSTEQVMKKFSIVLAALATIAIAAPQTASAMDEKGAMPMHHHKMHHKMMRHHKMMHHEKMEKHDKM